MGIIESECEVLTGLTVRESECVYKLKATL